MTTPINNNNRKEERRGEGVLYQARIPTPARPLDDYGSDDNFQLTRKENLVPV